MADQEQAFPSVRFDWDSSAAMNEKPFPYNPDTTDGMSLRDYFAAKAIEGHIPAAVTAYYQHGGVTPREFHDHHAIAASAYELADAMMAAREAKP